MKKYKVYDLYEGKDVVGYADTLNEVKRLAREWFRDTVGRTIPKKEWEQKPVEELEVPTKF